MAGCEVGIMHEHLHISQELGQQAKGEVQITEPVPLELREAIQDGAAVGVS
jgi:hypothetical protein